MNGRNILFGRICVVVILKSAFILLSAEKLLSAVAVDIETENMYIIW